MAEFLIQVRELSSQNKKLIRVRLIRALTIYFKKLL